MPLVRRTTPPPEATKQSLTVMESLNAWTTDEDHENDEPKIKKLPLGYTPFAQADRTAPVTGWRVYFDTESDSFNLIIGLVIICNAVVIGLETDLGRSQFTIFEHFFNAVFVLEMLTRLGHIGCDYFTTPSYLFDCSLVITGTLDLWILPALHPHASKHNTVGYQFSVMRLLRILRLLRVLRVIRLFRMFGQLLLMVRAFGKAIQVVLLLSVLVFILIYALSIVCTQLLGHNAEEWGEEADSVRTFFGNIPTTMTTLFWVMFGCSWDPLIRLLTHVYTAKWVLVFLGAYMVITVALLALIVGLLCESLIIAQSEFRQRMLDKFAIAKKEFASNYAAELKEQLQEETNSVGSVDAEHLKEAIQSNADLVPRLIKSGVQTNNEILLILVDSMSKGGCENVNLDNFVEKLINLTGFSTASAVVDLKYDMARNRKTIEKVVGDVEAVQAELAKSQKLVQVMAQKMEEISRKVK